MSRTRFAIGVFWVGLMILCTGTVSSQNYPTKAIHIIAGSVGGGNDFIARLIGQGISVPLGQPVIVDNVAGGSLGSAEATLRAPRDGYTIVVIGSAIWIVPLLQTRPTYDPVTDFAPITLISKNVAVLAVHPSLPVKSARELIVLAKARPGELNHGTGGIGGSFQIAMRLFKSMAGVNIVEVVYKGEALSMAATMSGEVQVTMPDVGLTLPHMKSGKLRGLGVTSATPSLVAPELPTVAASGLPGFEYVGMTGILAPGNTPAAVISRLNQEIVRVFNRPEVKEQFLVRGEEIVANLPEQFTAIIKLESAKTAKVIKESGLRVQ